MIGLMELSPSVYEHAAAVIGRSPWEVSRDRELLFQAHAAADEIVEMLMEPIISDIPYKKGDNVLMFVNGMGGTPLIELYIVFNELRRYLEGRGVTIARNLIGPYITSLEMAGCSITLLKLDDELTKLWDAPVKTPGLRWGV